MNGPQYVVPANVVRHRVDGESVAMVEPDLTLHRLNVPATALLDVAEEPVGLPDLVAALADAFGAPADVVDADVRTLLPDLLGAGLLVERPSGTAPDGSGRSASPGIGEMA